MKTKENKYLFVLFCISCICTSYLLLGNGQVDQDLFVPLDKLVMYNPALEDISEQVPNLLSAVKKVTGLILELF